MNSSSLNSLRTVTLWLIVYAVLLGHFVSASAEDATVLWADGDVQLQTAGSGDLQPVTGGAAVPEGSRIVTAENASCGLGFSGPLTESAVMLKSSSSATVKSLGDSALIDLERGAIFTKLAKLKKDVQFEVRTPTATATARGTGWQQSPDRIEVFDGTVSLKNPAGREEALSTGEGYELALDGAFLTKISVSDSSRGAWEEFGKRVLTSPYFNRISADDILHIRDTIDAKRKSVACGAAANYAWKTTVAPGEVISSSQINELKTALTKLPFAQSPAFVATYLDPIPESQSGEPVRASTLQLLMDAAENASC